MHNMNFIPPKYLEKEKVRKKKLVVIIITLVSFAALALISILPYKIVSDLKREKAFIDEKVSSLENVYVKGQQYDSIYFLYKQRESIAQKMDYKGIDIPSLFSHLEKNATKNLVLTNISVSKDSAITSVNVTGTGTTKNDIATFVSFLEKDAYFSQVIINSISMNETANEGLTNNSFGLDLKISH